MLRVAEQAYRTDTGRQRSANEDALFARAPVFAVADGMGGAQAGEVAARIATEAFEPGEERDESPEAYLRAVAEAANGRIHELAERNREHSGMGTTLTAALVEGDEVSLAHVGDSRAYVLRQGELRQLTVDHSLVEELRRQGRLTEEQAEEHPQRSIITRALGPEADVEVDTMTYPTRDGDVFLLCSDGLTTMVSDERIAGILEAAGTLDAAVSRLVREANRAGGRDNITVVAFRVEEAAAPVPEEQPTLIGPTAEEEELTAERVRAAAAREAPPPARHRWPRRLLVAAITIVAMAAIGVAAAYGWRQVHFLGVDEGGRLALYRGLPYELPLGIELYDEVYSSPIQLGSVAAERRDAVTDHELRSEDDAISLLEDLERTALSPQGRGRAGGGKGK